MAESATRSEKDHNEKLIEATGIRAEGDHERVDASTDRYIAINRPIVIWTPRFITAFVLTLVAGLSAASLLTQGWLNGYYPGDWVLLAFVALIFVAWIAVAACARSFWARIGAIAGCVWSIFTGISFVMNLLAVDPQSAIIAQLNAATNSALLGCYLCLSINRTSLHRWDGRFFRFAPLLGACVIAAIYLLTPAATRSWQSLESTTAAVMLYLAIFVWWLRPSCWKTQPGPTFLFGIAPIILLILAIPNSVNGEGNFFFSQVVLLCLLLGVIRILQCEIRH